MDTIFALASARGRSGVAVVRISGPSSWEAVARLCGRVPPPRRLSLRRLANNGVVLDDAMVVVFEQGRSFTGERSAELHLHGSVATVAAVLGALAGAEGLRQAEPGEFTRRALENGRLDLTQVEGLADLIDAETEAQRRQALRVLSGEIGNRADGWRRKLVRAAALIEATIDFSDEDIPTDLWPEVMSLVAAVDAELEREERGFGAAERIRDGFEVAIIGAPNAGKSTLLNAIAGREAALTSEHPGTTRDVIEVRMDLGGLAVTFLDTAGIREAASAVEEMGIERAMQRADQADLRIFLSDGGVLPPGIEPEADDLVVQGKADLGLRAGVLGVSGLTGAGVKELLDEIGRRLAGRVGAPATMTRERHRRAVRSARSALGNVLAARTGAESSSEIVADEVRAAIRSLDSLVGRVDVEDLLDVIFSSFCIGK